MSTWKTKDVDDHFVTVGRKQLYADVMEEVRRLKPGETYFAEELRRPRGVSVETLRKRISSAVSLHVRSSSRYRYRVHITTDGQIAVECLK